MTQVHRLRGDSSCFFIWAIELGRPYCFPMWPAGKRNKLQPSSGAREDPSWTLSLHTPLPPIRLPLPDHSFSPHQPSKSQELGFVGVWPTRFPGTQYALTLQFLNLPVQLWTWPGPPPGTQLTKSSLTGRRTVEGVGTGDGLILAPPLPTPLWASDPSSLKWAHWASSSRLHRCGGD